ncbi:Bifunctional transcriptional activator/DNA repair enzyme AdaA [Paenibacillus sp. P1XP2]|nr:Bifunctional transcriptional activator/DNA repair enzyme AdaA [Paenibacillus sp. P1XP2]
MHPYEHSDRHGAWQHRPDHDAAVESTPLVPNEIQSAVSYIESHYSCPLKVEDIANHVHLSPYYFSRLFRKTTGCTVMEYIMKHRVQEAKRLLADPSHEIGTVAELVGFCNHSYFAKLFARHVGVSPSRYRQSIR